MAYILKESAEIAKLARLKLKYLLIGIRARSIFTDQQYIVFYLKNVKHLKYNVIADIMGVKPSTIRWHYMNCLKKIREL